MTSMQTPISPEISRTQMQFPGSSAHEDSFFGEALPAAFLSEASREILRAKEALCQYDRSYTAVVSPTTEPSMNRIGRFVLQRPLACSGS